MLGGNKCSVFLKCLFEVPLDSASQVVGFSTHQKTLKITSAGQSSFDLQTHVDFSRKNGNGNTQTASFNLPVVNFS